MAKTYHNTLNTKAKAKALATATPQTQIIPGREKEMTKNSAGGASFIAGIWTMLDRFLILGTEGGTYYATERELTVANAQNAVAAIKEDGVRAVNRLVEISVAGRAPKNDAALFVLALALTHGDGPTKAVASEAIPKVARIGTHMFTLAQYVNGMRSWGRPIRRGFDAWYNGKKPLDLAMQMTKYANRNGWTHADVIRLAHVKPATETTESLFITALDKPAKELEIDGDVAEYMYAVEQIKALGVNARDVTQAVKLITDFKLPREVLPTELLNQKDIWAALLPHMGMEAMVRNLATMTRVGLIAPLSDGVKLILDKMQNEDAVKKSRLHPIKVLAALLTYKVGHGQRGTNTWTPVGPIVSELNELFYRTFQNIIPTGKRILIGLDVSGSMTMGEVGGILGLSPRIASAALAMMTVRTEQQYEVCGFSTTFLRLGITASQSLEQVCKMVERLPFAGTDCSLPMEWAIKNKVPVDGFLIYTDSETFAGRRQPSQALKAYRQAMGIDAKTVVVGMTSTNFTIADPKDAGMLDVVGFDTATPSLMSDFVRGDF
jgi:60 kDa SS-A/Ro ribonucleoprotein